MENLTVPKPERGSLMLHTWMHKKVYSKVEAAGIPICLIMEM